MAQTHPHQSRCHSCPEAAQFGTRIAAEPKYHLSHTAQATKNTACLLWFVLLASQPALIKFLLKLIKHRFGGFAFSLHSILHFLPSAATMHGCCTIGKKVLNSLHHNRPSWALTEARLMSRVVQKTRGAKVYVSAEPAPGMFQWCWAEGEEGKSTARLRDAFECRSSIWYDFTKLTFEGQMMRYAAFRCCIHKPSPLLRWKWL